MWRPPLVALTVFCALLFSEHVGGQQPSVPASNVNVISGIGPDGDWTLQRQNEPSGACSTRNPQNCLVGANDYRSVDIPFPNDAGRVIGDAWLGWYTTKDAGLTWRTRLLPGFPQDASPEGLASPLKGSNAGADPVVRSGAFGMFFYSGITFNRAVGGGSKVFVARFIDHNDRERTDVDSIVYLDTKVIQSAPDGTETNFFIDKPWLAVDVPRTGTGSCQISTRGKAKGKIKKSQSLPCARLFLSYTVFGGPDGNQRGTIMTTWSDNNGETWSKPRPLHPDLDVNDDGVINSGDVQAVRAGRGQRCQTPAYDPPLDVNVDCVVDKMDETAITQGAGTPAMAPGHRLHQGAAVAIAPTSGNVYLAFRQFRLGADADALFISKSIDGGRTYSTPVLVSTLAPFDQNTTGSTFRSNAFPSLAIDDLERVYLAWTTRGLGTFRPDPITGDTRVVVATSQDGIAWSPPRPVDNHSGPGHQFMPSIVFAAGQLQLLYYDQREDLSGLFGPFVDELPILNGPSPRIRHTTEVRAAHADPGLDPIFTSVQISDYLVGVPPGGNTSMRLQYHPPNLPMFRLGTAPFMGDYIEIIPSQPMVQEGDQFRFNTAPASSPLFHAFWTDNRDVRPPPDGDWTRYTPPNPPFARPTTSGFDPTQTIPECTPGFVATRNQNIYTTRVSRGLVAAALTNSKQLSATLSRSFPVYVQNNTATRRSYRMSIRTQPPGGRASFDQFTPIQSLDVQVPARSTIARSVHVTSSDPRATVPVDVVEITAPGGTPVIGGQTGEIVLNPDPTNPDVDNPDVDNPDVDNPDVDNPDVDNAEVFNPDVDNATLLGLANPDVDNPDVDNPDVDNVLVVNPSIVTADPGSPDVSNPDVDNPDVDNPDVDNADLINGGLTDTTWTMTNRGNTAASYAVKLLLNRTLPPGFRSQLIVHRIYQTPSVLGCDLKQQTQNVLLVNLPDPSFVQAPDVANPDVDNPDVDNVTVAIPPGEQIQVTLRVYDPNRFDAQTFDAVAAVTPAMVAHSVDTVAVSQGVTTPEVSAPLLPPAPEPPAAPVGGAYSYTPPPPTGPGTWSIVGGTLPPGLTLNPTSGAITGTATTSGEFTFILRFVDANGIEDFQTITIQVAAPSVFANLAVSINDTPDPAVLGSPVTYTIAVSNAGPSAAAGVATTQSLPLGATLISATPSQGTCTVSTTVNCALGSIANGSSASIVVVITSGVADFASSTVSAESSTPDPIATNNTAATVTLIQAFAACSAPTFSGPRFFPTGVAGNFVVSLGDFNNDGNIDALSSQNNALTLLPGDGSGGFGSAVTIPVVSTAPAGIAVADFNEDGDLDVVVPGSSSDVLVLLGTGAGAFTAAPSIPAGFASFVAEPGDFNNDGNLDLIVGGTTGQMAFVAGNGDGSFDAPVTTTIGTGIIQFVVADFNSDGLLDAATSDRGTSVVTLRTGDGAGGFTLALTLNPGVGARLRQGLGDINNDGNADLSVTIGSAPSMQSLIYLGNGAGGFGAPIDAQAGGTAQYTSAADITGDGVLDLVAIHPVVGKVGAQVGASGPTFGSVASFATAQAAHLRLADINGDLKPDIVLATAGPQGGVSVFLNTCSAATADLAVGANDAPDPIAPGGVVTYSMTVTNNGPNPASAVMATAALQNEPHIVSATASQGSCTFIDLQATCELGTLASGASATVSVGAGSSLAGSTFSATVGATSDQADPNAANSAITLATGVSGAPAPTITTVAPSSGQQGATLDVAITGQNTNFVQGQTAASFELGITVNSVTVASPTSATANITIDATTIAGARNITLTTGGEIVTSTGGFSVTAGPAIITQIAPSSAQQGQSLSVDITGSATHFEQGLTSVSLTRAGSTGAINVNTVTVTSPTTLTAQLSVTASATPGTWTVSAVTGGENAVLADAFTVVGTTPAITSVLPNQGQQGQPFIVGVAGQATSFVQGQTTANFGPGITINSVTVTSATVADVNLTIDPTAFTGPRDVTLTTGSEIATLANGFTVTSGPATIALLNPNTALQGQSLAVQITGQATHFVQDVTTANFGPNITVNSVTVTSETAATANITVAPLASAGARTVTLTTLGELASIVNGFTVQSVVPVVSGTTPSSAQQGQTLDVAVTGQNTNFQQGVTAADFGIGIGINTVTVTSATTATINLSIDPIATTGSRSVQMTTGAEVATGATFVVLASPAALTQVSPNSADQGEAVSVSVTGQNTHFAEGVTTASVSGGGVTAGPVTVTSATTATVLLTVELLAAPGARTVTLTTGGEQAKLVNGFTVVAATPVIVSANPNTGQQNATLDVVVTGQLTNFQQGVTTASFGAGITVNSVTVASPTSAIVNITISPLAFTGGRTITLTTGAESAQSASNAFTVLGGNASLAPLNPTSGQQGATLDVTITGNNTHFSQALSTASFGAGIVVNQLVVTNATTATANISISAQAAVGPRTVVVSTAGEIAERDDGFTVTAGQPTIANVNPPTGRQAETLNVQVTGQLTNFLQGTTTASFGAGIVVNTVTVTNLLNATVNVTIDPTAALGSRTVTLTTGTEVASSVGGYTVLAGQPTLLSVNPIVGTQGESSTVVLNGAFTNFTQGVTTVSFGSGISVGTLTVNGPTLASVPITINPFATTGARSVTVTTGTEVATLVNGFTVIAGTPVLTVIDPNIGRPNENTTVIVSGEFTSFQQGATMASFGADVSVNGGAAGALAVVTVVSSAQFTAQLSIAAGAQLGPRNVIVQTGAESLTAVGGFTVTDVEAIPPSVFKVSPANGATDVPLNARVQVEFSEPMDRTTVTASSFVLRDNTTFLPVPSTVSVDVTGRVATLIPSQLLAVNRSHSVLLSSGAVIRDASGNAMPGTFPSNFTTGFVTDTTGPLFVTLSIADGDSDIPLNTDVVLEFSKPINPVSQPLGAQVQLAGVPVPGTYTFSAGNQILTFQPANPLAASALYDVVLSNQLTDAAGNSLANPGSFSFTTGTVSDNTSGTVVASNPNSGAIGVGVNTQLRATFSERIDPVSVSTGFVQVSHPASGRIHPAVVTVAGDRRSLTLTTTQPLRPETSYTFQVFGLKDLAGNFFNGFSAPFTTAAGLDTLAPSVTSISPVDNAIDVPVNVAVVVEMSEAIDPTSVPGAVQLTPAVTGTLTLSGGTTLTFVPATPLAVSTQYGVTVSGLRDLAGHMLPQPFTSTFTTRAVVTADTTPPTVGQTVPDQGATNVSVTSTIVIPISEPIVASAVDEDSVRVLANVSGLGFVQVAGTLSVDPTATVITFTPLTPYPGNTPITVQVNANSTIDDLAGNNLTFATRTFTTAAATDTTSPAIIGVMPLNGTVNVGLNAVVTLTFSESLAPNTVNNSTFALFANGQPHSVSVTRSSDNRTVMLNTTLPADSLITVVATSGVTDLAGNELADFTSTFATTANVDTTIGQVVTVRPASGATNVPPTTPLTLFVSKPVNSTSVPPSLWVAQNGVLVTGGISATGGGTAIHFVPTVPFAPGAFVQVFLEGAVDQSGNAVPSFQASFTIASNSITTAPTVLRVAPTGTDVPINAIAEIELSEPIDPATAIPANVRLLSQSFQVLPSAISFRADDRIIRLVPTDPLAANQTTFIQVLSGLLDLQGQPVSGGLASFTTGDGVDATPPTVLAVTPPDDVTDVGINALVRVRFSEPINPLTVSGATIQVTAGGFVAVPASFSFNPGDTEVTVTSVQPLPDATVLTITINGVQDRAGLNVTPLTTSFITRTGADTRGPTLLRASVFANQTGVPVNSVFVGEFDEPLDPQSVSSLSVVLRDNIFFVPVPATVALNPDGRSLTLTPTTALAVGRSFSLFFNFSTALRDLAGNASTGTSVTFVTSFQPDTTPPTIVASNPVDGDVNIPTNVRLKVLFDEAIDANTLDGILVDGGAPVATALSNGNRMVTVGLETLLAPSTSHTLSIAGLRDTSGNLIVPVPISFTTGAGADLIAATVIASNPDPNDTNVGVNTVMRAVFSEPIDPTTVASGIVRVVHSATGAVHPAVVSVAADRRSLTLTPTEPLLGSRQYSFQVFGLLDQAGNSVNGFSASFVTAAAADGTVPTVVSISPVSGSVDVPVNVRLVLRMSEAIDPTSLPAAVQLTPSVNARLTLSTDGTTLTFAPLNPLAVSTSYGVAVSGLRDLAGNVMAPFASTFTTRASATADVTAPTVVQSVPANGATGVAVNSQIEITISEPIVASAVNVDSVRVLANVTGIGFVQVAGTLTVDPTATVITFTPLTPYPGDTQITLQVNANSSIDDLAGNNLTFASRTFTTAAATDTTPPTVVAVMPLSGTLNVGLNAVVTLTFSESLAPATVNNSTFELFAGAQQLNPSVSRSSDNRTVTLTATLPPQALITVVATSGVTDLAGNALADFTSTFVTGATIDTTIGHVVTVRPISGATGVPSTTSLTLYLTKPVDAASVAPALRVAANGILVTGTTTVSGAGTAIHFVPTVPFAPSALVQVFLEGAQDTAGNVIQSFQASFTIASNPATTAPTVVRVSPTGTGAPLNAVVEVEISEAVNPATVSEDTVRVFNQTFQQIILTTRTLRADDRIIRMVPTSPLNAGETYFIQVLSGLQDLQGQGVAGGLFSFSTGAAADAVVPTVEAVSPPNDAANVGINALVRVRFSETINPLTVSADTIQVTASGFTAVPASISFNPADTEVALTPLQPLPDATVVTITVNGVEDRAGQSVTPVTTTFTTRTGADTRIPTLTGVSVFANQTGVPVNSVFVGEFDEELDPLSVNTLSVVLRENVTFQTVPVTVALNPDGRTITVTPTSTLVVNRSHTVFFNFSTGLRDLAGNQATGGSVTFTTSSDSDTTPPTVLLTVPNDNLTDVPTNTRVLALFDEPIDATQLEQVLLLQGATPLVVTRALSNGNRTLTLTPPTLLATNTAYTLLIAGIPDTAGNVMAGVTQATFTTGAGVDLTRPLVTAFVPAHNTSGVPVNVAPQVTFNEAIDPLTVTGNVVLRLTATSVVVPVTYGFSADYRTVTLTPTAPLAAGTQYTIAVTNFSVRDLAGNFISNTGTANFVTQ